MAPARNFLLGGFVARRIIDISYFLNKLEEKRKAFLAANIQIQRHLGICYNWLCKMQEEKTYVQNLLHIKETTCCCCCPRSSFKQQKNQSNFFIENTAKSKSHPHHVELVSDWISLITFFLLMRIRFIGMLFVNCQGTTVIG